MKINNPTIPKFPITINNNDQYKLWINRFNKLGYVGYFTKKPLVFFNRIEDDFPLSIDLHLSIPKKLSIRFIR